MGEEPLQHRRTQIKEEIKQQINKRNTVTSTEKWAKYANRKFTEQYTQTAKKL